MSSTAPSKQAGTGRDGRVTRRDVLAYLDCAQARPPVSVDGRTVVPFDNIRKLTAEHMVRSKATSPHVLQAVDDPRLLRSRAIKGHSV